MEIQSNFSPLSPQQLDPEMFRRVWARVMPNQEDSPIVVAPPTHSRPVRPPSPAPQEKRPTPPSLPDLLDHLHTGVLQAQVLVRRTGGNPGMQSLLRSRQQAMRQLSASHFLATGQRFRPAIPVPPPPTDLPQALRVQFLWEQRWARDCLSAAKQSDDPTLSQLLQKLSDETHLRIRIIRSLLERM